MTLLECAEFINVDLVVTRFPRQKGRWCCQFECARVREGAVLVSTHGNGPTPDAAMQDYAQQIAGKQLEVRRGSDTASLYNVPEDLVHVPPEGSPVKEAG